MRSGHEVALVCFNRKGLPPRESVDGIEVVRLGLWPPVLRKVQTFFNNMPYVNPAWSGFVEKAAVDWGADALHVHDLPLVKTVLAVGRRIGRPVVFDMHENWAELLPSVPRRLIERVAATRFTFKQVEREVCMEVDAVVVVVEESRDRLVGIGVDPGKILVVPNVADLEHITERAGEEEKGRTVFIYAGGFAKHRGLDVLLRGWARFIREGAEALLVLAGAGPDEDGLRALAGSLGVGESVEFAGWLSFESYLDRISRCSVGLVPHLSTPHTDSTLPHKLFHYMAFGKPVIVGDAIPLERIVGEEDCGLVVASGDDAAMAEALRRLHADPELRRRMGGNGRRAVWEKYNWDVGIKPLLEFYASLEKAGR